MQTCCILQAHNHVNVIICGHSKECHSFSFNMKQWKPVMASVPLMMTANTKWATYNFQLIYHLTQPIISLTGILEVYVSKLSRDTDNPD
jgi:hypothetical protein